AVRPELLNGVSDWRDGAHAGDDDAGAVSAIPSVLAVAAGHAYLRTQTPAYVLTPRTCARASAATKSEPATHINAPSPLAAIAESTASGTLSTIWPSTPNLPNVSAMRCGSIARGCSERTASTRPASGASSSASPCISLWEHRQ